MKIEMRIEDEVIEFDIPDDLFKHIETFAKQANMPVEQAITQALMTQMEKEDAEQNKQ